MAPPAGEAILRLRSSVKLGTLCRACCMASMDASWHTARQVSRQVFKCERQHSCRVGDAIEYPQGVQSADHAACKRLMHFVKWCSRSALDWLEAAAGHATALPHCRFWEDAHPGGQSEQQRRRRAPHEVSQRAGARDWPRRGWQHIPCARSCVWPARI